MNGPTRAKKRGRVIRDTRPQPKDCQRYAFATRRQVSWEARSWERPLGLTEDSAHERHESHTHDRPRTAFLSQPQSENRWKKTNKPKVRTRVQSRLAGFTQSITLKNGDDDRVRGSFYHPLLKKTCQNKSCHVRFCDGDPPILLMVIGEILGLVVGPKLE